MSILIGIVVYIVVGLLAVASFAKWCEEKDGGYMEDINVNFPATLAVFLLWPMCLLAYLLVVFGSLVVKK